MDSKGVDHKPKTHTLCLLLKVSGMIAWAQLAWLGCSVKPLSAMMLHMIVCVAGQGSSGHMGACAAPALR